MYNIFQKYKSAFVIFVKILIVGGAYYIISKKIIINSNFLEHIDSNVFNNYILLLTILSFSISNWLLEVLKWKSLVNSIRYISFYEALKQSSSSLTSSLLTPNRIGEYGAKAMFYPKNQRSEIMLLNFLGNFSQMTITVLFGIIGLFFLSDKISFSLQITSFQIFSLGIISCIIIFFFFNDKLSIYRKKTIYKIKSIPTVIHFKNLIFSFLRYLVFSHQFYFIIVAFGVDLNYNTIMPIIFTMYFISSIIPGFVIFDWLIKGSVAVSVFSLYGVNEIIVLSVTSIMWILNFAIPSLIGSYFVLTFSKATHRLKESKIHI